MPHVLVIHSDGATSKTKLSKAWGVVDRGLAFWKGPIGYMIQMRRSTDDAPANGYEYGGKKSYCVHDTVEACDLRTHAIIRVPVESRDRTLTPVRAAGGAKVLQLKPLQNRRGQGRHTTMHDRLWRPERPRKPKL